MRILSLRLILALIAGITLVSLASSWYEVQTEKDVLRRDLEHKSETLGESLAANAESYLETRDQNGLDQLVQRFGDREHLLGIGIYNTDGSTVARSSGLNRILSNTPTQLAQSLRNRRPESEFQRVGLRQFHVLATPLYARDGTLVGGLVVVHDAAYIRIEILRIWSRVFLHIAIQVLVIAAITFVVVRWSLIGPITRLAQWMKASRIDPHSIAPTSTDLDFLLPLTREVRPLAESMHQARAAAEMEARLRNSNESIWTSQRLADHVKNKLGDSTLFVVSNREPYIHTRHDDVVTVSVPASGLVTAIEPILCACHGTWIAHGSGNADAETVDGHDRLKVPPHDPRYTLRRVWLSAEEEDGYYNGFANEGLWPLCHIAHARPTFRASDWEHYTRVNEKFANAVLKEVAGETHPVILIQDYHFALLPRMLKERLPEARIAIFWHIPWPNPESFGICPWQRSLLDGLLGADLIGFHIQSHCNNFLNTVDRALEARVNWEHFSVKRNDHRSTVRPFPISVEFTDTVAADVSNADEERAAILKELGLEATFIGLGVDRVDYTKGIIERFQAVETFIERHPKYQGKFTFIQIGAPSRSRIKRYAEFQTEVQVEADRINARFKQGRWRPIVFINRQHDHAELQRFYRAAHLCLVTSLHDGMNLVSKEYVAARSDERGVLILSRFTGAARELRDAIIVNPYDVQNTAEAIATALTMDVSEMTDRMRRMRKTVKEHNIYWWAGALIAELCDLRLSKKDATTRAVSNSAPLKT